MFWWYLFMFYDDYVQPNNESYDCVTELSAVYVEKS